MTCMLAGTTSVQAPGFSFEPVTTDILVDGRLGEAYIALSEPVFLHALRPPALR